MPKIIKLLTLPLITLLILLVSSLTLTQLDSDSSILPEVKAGSLCPEGMSDKKCLEYLEQKQAALAKRRREILSKINQENSNQQDLNQKIASLANEIEANEVLIEEKEVAVEIKTIEVNVLANEVADTQMHIDTIKQEMDLTSQKINDRIYESYKQSMISPWLLFLTGRDLTSTIEQISYLTLMRKSDQVTLNNLQKDKLALDREEALLAQQKEKIMRKRDLIEAENAELLQIEKELEDQKAKQNGLLAESHQKELEYQQQKKKLDKLQNKVQAEVVALAMKLLNKGQLGNGVRVQKGSIIGFQGHTGCSFGSHLHFGIANSPTTYYTNVNPFAKGYLKLSGSIIRSGSLRAPEASPLITQWWHGGKSLDMVSTGAGLHNGSKYCKSKGQIKCAPWVSGCFNKNGEGAPIYALARGKHYKGVDQYGGRYSIIKHDNGLVSIYWHLR